MGEQITLPQSEAEITFVIFFSAACFQRAQWQAVQRSLCACRPSVVSHSGAAINSRELLGSLNSASSAPSCKLELHRALLPLSCHVEGMGDKAIVNGGFPTSSHA